MRFSTNDRAQWLLAVPSPRRPQPRGGGGLSHGDENLLLNTELGTAAYLSRPSPRQPSRDPPLWRQEGRQSGDSAWIASRGEGGEGGDSSASAGGPSSEAGSRLVGVPLGAVQPGGGLTLCVGAVVERSGDASVLVGGTAVSRLSGRGRGALCAAAVSADTGFLLAAKTFVLGGGQAADAAAGAASWLAGLPDGTVVVMAGGGAEKDSSTDPGLAEAIAGLVGDVGADTAPGSSIESNTFALVGWKGPGEREWARRQRRGSGDKGGRCALHAELLLLPPPPPTASGGQPAAGSTRQVELQDKLCLCPLRSGGDAEPAFAPPARGACRREGEPTVLVGPTVDPIHCPGWTTVLQAPGDDAAAAAAAANEGGGREKKVLPPTAWMVTTVSSAVGGKHEDTHEFDDGPVG